MVDIGTLGGNISLAWAINNNGQITGYSETISGDTHAFLYEDGVMKDLGTMGGAESRAYGISETGQVVGWSINSLN